MRRRFLNPAEALTIGGWFSAAVREASELLPRYRDDNVFDSTKFANRFPEFTVSTYRQGITATLDH